MPLDKGQERGPPSAGTLETDPQSIMVHPKLLAVAARIGVGLALLAGCGSRTDSGPQGTDTSSHWLSRCDEDSSCPSDQRCLCGVCTQTCDEAGQCRRLDTKAVCASVDGCDPQLICTLEEYARSPDTSDDECAFVSDTASDGALCLSEPAQCEQFKSETVERAVSLTLNEARTSGADTAPFTAQELEARRTCVVSWLSERGLSATSDNNSVLVTAAWSALAPLVASSAVSAYEVQCDDCGYCSDLDEAACGNDAFCMPYVGSKVNYGLECLDTPQMYECIARASCDDAITVAGNGYNCWIFASGCPIDSLVPGTEYCAYWDDEYLDLFQNAKTCEDASSCYDASDPGLSYSLGSVGCECPYEGAAVCNMFALSCIDGRWDAGQDGICIERYGRCDRSFPTLDECLDAGFDCLTGQDSGTDPICAIERSGATSERPLFTAEQCQQLGGEVSPYSEQEVWVRMTNDGEYCKAKVDSDWYAEVRSDACTAAGGRVDCREQENVIFCQDDETAVAALVDCEIGEGYCCLPDRNVQ